jgi:rhodanese-related sulfurtransferase
MGDRPRSTARGRAGTGAAGQGPRLSPLSALSRLAYRCLGLPHPADPRTTLAAVEDAILRRLGGPEILPALLAERLAGPPAGRPVVFDVRTAAEFAESRIAGAIRLDPGLSARAFAVRHGTLAQAADVVLYCAVGWRSGRMMRRLRGRIGAASVSNLRGGLFRWHAEGWPLEGAAPAPAPHPFDADWGALLRRTLAAKTQFT